jgi:asparagine synthase (glutamine-hydrolysing)
VTYTYPFLHRPLVEFMLAIPGEQLSAPGQTRALMRRAFDNIVPARILRRVSKGYYPPAALRSARQLAQSMLPADRLEVVRRGWIDPRQLEAAIRILTDGSGETDADVQRVLRLEQWLTSRHRRAPAAIPQRKEVRTNAVLNA